MKKKLFFNSKLQKTKKREMSFVFSVLLFLMFFIPSSFSASSTQQNSADGEQQSTAIYISGNAKIFGAENSSEIEVVATITNENFSTKTNVEANPKSSDNSIAAQVEEKITKDLAKSKELEKQAKENVKVTFTKTTTNSNFAGSNSAISKGAVLNSNFYSKHKFSKAISQDIAISYACKSNVKKQNFYTSLSYVQFRKYKNSSLRGPPNKS